MSSLDAKSLQQLSTCHLDLQKVAMTAIRWTPFSIVEGQRGQEKQHKAFVEGRSKVDWPNGKHNATPSDAFDFLPAFVTWNDLNGVNGKEKQRRGEAACYKLAGFLCAIGEMLEIPLRSGTDWDGDGDLADQTLNDLVHIERRK